MDFEHTQTLEWLESQPKTQSSQIEREEKQQINQMLNFLDVY